MFFKEQAWIFVQLIIFKAPLPIFVSSYLSKKQSICMLISVYKIFKSKISFKCCCQCTLQLLRTLKVVDIKYLSECHFSYNYHNHGENHSHTRGFFNLVSKQKKIKMKIWNSMAHSHRSKVISIQNQGVQFFCCLGHGA